MKKIFILASFFYVTAQAAGPVYEGCIPLYTLCQSKGFTEVNPPSLKHIWSDCILPMIKGETIEGLKPKAADVATCKTSGDKPKTPPPAPPKK